MVIANTRTGEVIEMNVTEKIEFDSLNVKTGVKDHYKAMTLEEACKIEERYNK